MHHLDHANMILPGYTVSIIDQPDKISWLV